MMRSTRRIVLLFVSAIGFLLVLEAGLRVRAYRLHGDTAVGMTGLTVDDPVLGKRLRPGAEQSGKYTKLSINSLGFRGHEIARDKPPGVLRIYCLGDSVVFGKNARDDDSVWTAVLGRRLSQLLGRPVETINGGAPGYSLGQSGKLLMSRGLELEPDVVLVCQLINDLNQRCRFVFAGPGNPKPTPPEFGLGVPLARLRDQNWLTHHLIQGNLTPLVTPLGLETTRVDRVPDGFAAGYESDLAELVRDARVRGLRVVLCTAWRAYGPDQPEAEQLRFAKGQMLNNPWLSLDGLNDAFAKYNDAVRSVAADTGAPLLDLARIVPPGNGLYGDAVHLSAKGHVEVGGLMAEHLAPLVEAPAP